MDRPPGVSEEIKVRCRMLDNGGFRGIERGGLFASPIVISRSIDVWVVGLDYACNNAVSCLIEG